MNDDRMAMLSPQCIQFSTSHTLNMSQVFPALLTIDVIIKMKPKKRRQISLGLLRRKLT